jgi:hypothetical protein
VVWHQELGAAAQKRASRLRARRSDESLIFAVGVQRIGSGARGRLGTDAKASVQPIVPSDAQGALPRATLAAEPNRAASSPQT